MVIKGSRSATVFYRPRRCLFHKMELRSKPLHLILNSHILLKQYFIVEDEGAYKRNHAMVLFYHSQHWITNLKIWVRDSILPAATMLIPQVELRSKPLHLTLLLNLLIKDWEIFKIPPQQWHALSSLDVATNNSTTKWFASSKLTNFNPRQCSTGRDDAYPTKWNWDRSLCIWLKLKTYHLKTLESRRSELSWTNFDHH